MKAVTAALLLAAAGPASAADLRANAQAWGEIDVSATPSPDWRITGMAVVRDGTGVPNPTLWGGGAVLDRRFGDVTISIGDLAVAVRSAASGGQLGVDVPIAAISYDWRIAGFDLSDRNRIEDLVGAPGNPWRYRNRLSVEHSVAGAGPLSGVFASEEVFYDLTARRWSRSRAQIGVGLAAARGQVRLYYLRQDDRFGLPRAVNALGAAWAFELR